jgi:hypothetical protein
VKTRNRIVATIGVAAAIRGSQPENGPGSATEDTAAGASGALAAPDTVGRSGCGAGRSVNSSSISLATVAPAAHGTLRVLLDVQPTGLEMGVQCPGRGLAFRRAAGRAGHGDQ